MAIKYTIKLIETMKFKVFIVLGISIFYFFPVYGQVSNSYEYDILNRLTKIQYQNGLVINYTYDPLGNRLTKTRTILLPVAAGAITGSPVVCKGADSVSYSVPVITNAGWYIWSLPPGATIIAGDSTRNILVNYSMAAQNGNLSVYGKNEAGSGSLSPLFSVTMTPAPVMAGTISGLSQVQTGQSGVTYSVAAISGATGYLWSLPTGASIVAGANTASITVDFSSGAASGNITVSGINSCGEGPSSPVFAVTVSAGVPANLVIGTTNITWGQDNCYSATQIITVAGSGATFIVQNGGSAEMIAGQKIRFLPGSKINSGGYLHGWISISGPWCGTTKSITEITNFAAENDSVLRASSEGLNWIVNAWPNPNSGTLHLVVHSVDNVTPVQLSLCNLLGEKYFSREIAGEREQEISLNALQPGMYLLHLVQGAKSEVIKVIRN